MLTTWILTELLVLAYTHILIHEQYSDLQFLGINVIRDTRTAAVNCEGFPALTTQAALDSLLDSLQRNNEFQLKQICDINLSKDGQDDALCLLSKKQDLIQNGERIKSTRVII